MATRKRAKTKAKPKRKKLAVRRTVVKKTAPKRKTAARPKARPKKVTVPKKPAVAKRAAVPKKPAAPKKAAVPTKPAAPKKAAVPTKPAAVRAPAAAPAAPPVPAVPPGEARIGAVIHYYTHLSVAIVQMESGSLREGDTVHIKGHTSDFYQPVGSMEVNHVRVPEVLAGQSFGLKVKEHAREHDVVYKAAAS